MTVSHKTFFFFFSFFFLWQLSQSFQLYLYVKLELVDLIKKWELPNIVDLTLISNIFVENLSKM
jgi:hypothetical protein